MREVCYHIESILQQQLQEIEQCARNNKNRSPKKKRKGTGIDLGSVNQIWRMRVAIANLTSNRELIAWLAGDYQRFIRNCSSMTLQDALLEQNQAISERLPIMRGFSAQEKLSISEGLLTRIEVEPTPPLKFDDEEQPTPEMTPITRKFKRTKTEILICHE